MSSPLNLDPYVRCPFCPDKMRRSLYEGHFTRLHAVDMLTGRKVPYAPPLDYAPPSRKKAPTERQDIPGRLRLFP